LGSTLSGSARLDGAVRGNELLVEEVVGPGWLVAVGGLGVRVEVFEGAGLDARRWMYWSTSACCRRMTRPNL